MFSSCRVQMFPRLRCTGPPRVWTSWSRPRRAAAMIVGHVLLPILFHRLYAWYVPKRGCVSCNQAGVRPATTRRARVNRGKKFMVHPPAVHRRVSECAHAAHAAEALVPAWTSFQYRRQALHQSTSQLTATARATRVGQIAPPRCEGERSVPLARTGGTDSPGSARDHSQATPSRSAGVSLAIALYWCRKLSCPRSHALKARIIPWETSLMV